MICFFFSCCSSANGEVVTQKWFWHFFSCDFSRETELCLVMMANTKYIVCLSFPGSQDNPNWVSNSDGEPNGETYALVQWHRIGHWLFVSEPVGNVFFLHAAIFEIPMPACWGADFSVDVYQLLLLSHIISPSFLVGKNVFKINYFYIVYMMSLQTFRRN